MARKHHKPEEIVAKLRQVEVLAGQGKPVAKGVRATGVTEATYYRCPLRQEVTPAMLQAESCDLLRSWRQMRVEEAHHLRMVVDCLRPERVGVVLRVGLALEHLQQRLDPGLPQLAVAPHRVGQEQVARA